MILIWIVYFIHILTQRCPRCLTDYCFAKDLTFSDVSEEKIMQYTHMCVEKGSRCPFLSARLFYITLYTTCFSFS